MRFYLIDKDDLLIDVAKTSIIGSFEVNDEGFKCWVEEEVELIGVGIAVYGTVVRKMFTGPMVAGKGDTLTVKFDLDFHPAPGKHTEAVERRITERSARG